ncbi:MAG: Uma2 family endonuclease, partial [Rhodomicrobium sp.]
MSADAFLAWAERQEQGRYQLARGEIQAMAPERAEHGDVKRRVANALEAAIKEKGLKCQAFVDSLGVKIDGETVFE